MLRGLTSCSAVVLLTLSACGEAGTEVGLRSARSTAHSISDAANGGNAHFYFLAPLVTSPTFAGQFDNSLSPVVRVCRWNGNACALPLIVEFTMNGGMSSERVRLDSAGEQYVVNWHTDQFDLDPSITYRLQVLVAGTELGYADVDVVTTGKELKNANSGQFIPLLNGRTLPIKFRIEKGAVFVVGAAGATIAALDGALSLRIPEGALAADVGITVRPTESEAVPALALGQRLGHGFRLLPDGLKLDKPATVRWDYSSYSNSVPDPAAIGIVHWNASGSFAEVIAVSNDLESHVLSFEIEHFSEVDAIGNSTDGWSVIDVRWAVPVIKWFVKPTTEFTYVNRERVAAALQVWQRETSSFAFQEVADAETANLVFVETGTIDRFEDTLCRLGFLVYVGKTCFGVTAINYERELDAGDQVKILIASQSILQLVQNPSDGALTVMIHEIGHALGINHPWRAAPTSGDQPIMAARLVPRTTLHPWDIAALRYHYAPPATAPAVRLFAAVESCLLRIDLVTQSSVASSCRAFDPFKALAADPLGYLFWLNTASPTNSGITRLQVSSGSTADIAYGPAFVAMVLDPQRDAFFAVNNGNAAYSVNKLTGAAQFLGTVTMTGGLPAGSSITDLALTADATTYAVVTNGSGTWLGRVDTRSFQATPVGFLGSRQLNGLSDAGNDLVALECNVASAVPNAVLSLDRTTAAIRSSTPFRLPFPFVNPCANGLASLPVAITPLSSLVAPLPRFPADLAVVSSQPFLRFAEVYGANKYRLMMAFSPTGLPVTASASCPACVVDETRVGSPISAGEVSWGWALQVLPTDRALYWRVQAINDETGTRVLGALSETRSFTIVR